MQFQMALPSQQISKSIGDVLSPYSGAANNKDNLIGLIKKATYCLGLVGMLPFYIIFLFGSDWIMAGEYARCLHYGVILFVNRANVNAL